MRYVPFNPAQPTLDELIEASSLGTPEAVALRNEGRQLLEATLTGMPEEQADWEAGRNGAPAETPSPTRADLARAVILWEAIAAEAKAQAAANRQVLDGQARTELETLGSAPTWRIPDVGTVPLALTSPAVVVEDQDAYVAWMAERYPTEVQEVQQVRPAFDAMFRADLAERGGPPADPGTGEVVPGLKFVEGGRPKGVSVRASAKARESVRAQARYLLGLPDPDES